MTSFPQQIISGISRVFPGALFYVPTAAPVVALTIDDVPTPGEPDDASTRAILQAIAQHNQAIAPAPPVRATFFVISGHLNAGSSLLPELLAAGHEIANHGVADNTHALLQAAAFEQQLNAAHDRLAAIAHRPIRWYRPGRGLYTRQMGQALGRLSQRVGYEVGLVLASMVPIDTFQATSDPAFTVDYVSRFVFPGAILVLHGGRRDRAYRTAAALPPLLAALHQQGYRVTSLGDLWDHRQES